MKHTFFFNNLNSCRRLKRKIKKVQTTISTSHVDESDTSTHPRSTNNNTESLNDDDGDSCFGTEEPPLKSSSSVWPNSEIPSPKQCFFSRSFTTIPDHQEKKKKVAFSSEEEMSIVGFKQMSNFSYHEEEVGVFGLNDDIQCLMKRLTHETRQEDMFVPIIGEAGSGKTTLARAVYKKRMIKEHFEVRDWISVTEEYTADCIKNKLQKSLGAVKGKRYLLVVDGIANCSLLQNQKLAFAFPDEDNGSKVIFTSRGTPEMKMNPHIMSGLKEEELWRMFMKKAGVEKEIKPAIKDKILHICRGLPLNIDLMAGLLSNKKITEWVSAFQYKQCCDEVLGLCYNDLSIHLKLCVSYMALFPKDYDIPVRRVLRLWLAEGFVEPSSKDKFPEDLAQEYFQELVDRSLIQITKLRSDNSPRQCRLVSVFHDYLLPKATNASLFYIHRSLEDLADAAANFGIRRIVHHMSTTASESDDSHQSHTQTCKYDPSILRSYVSFNFQPKDMPEKDAGPILERIISRNFRLLRVLDLEGVNKPSLPNKLGHLCQLRYLGLRRTSLDDLPESVGDLSFLETLDVKHTAVDTLPVSIWKLKQLRHLHLNNIRLAMPPSSCSTLLTLWGLVLDDKISISEDLGKLLDLRELGIKFDTKCQDGLLDWIAKLVNLQSLRLTSVDNMGNPLKLVLKPLMSLEKLSHLNLYGNLPRLLLVDEFMPILKVLTLSISKLKNDPMETLEKLPCLIVLRLLGDAFTGKRMVCHRGGFKELRVLKLWSLKELKEWDVEEDAMENLKELNIRSCGKLNDIHCRLLQKHKYLEELTLKDMPQEFVARIKKRKSKDTSLTTDSLPTQ